MTETAPLWVTLTAHTAHCLERAGVPAVMLDHVTPDKVQGRIVIVAPSAAKPLHARYAQNQLRAMGATMVAVVSPDLLHNAGAMDVADLIETAHANHQTPRLDILASLTVEQARSSAQEATGPLQTEGPTVQLLRGTDIRPEPIDWIWEGFLARGKLHMIAGATGAGKTTLALSIGATVSTGGRWPDGTRAERGNVLIWSGEDDPADTLLPRLIGMGADPGRIYFVGNVSANSKARPFDPARDIPALEREAARIGNVRLLVVDPIVNAVPGDSHKNTETRRALQPIVDLAERLAAAALGISHFSKGTAGREPVERVTGSVAFGALPRIIFAVARSNDEHGHTSRLFVRAKSNIGPDGGGFAFELKQVELPGFPGVIASQLMWGEPLEGRARDLLATVELEEPQGERGALTEAAEFLHELLIAGPVPARQVRRDAEGAGHVWRTVQEAARRLGVQRVKVGMKEGWTWSLPNAPKVQYPPKMHEEACTQGLHLRESIADQTADKVEEGDL